MPIYLNSLIIPVIKCICCIQDCVSNTQQLEDQLVTAKQAYKSQQMELALCQLYLGEEPTHLGVMGATVAGLSAVALARIFWRRCYGPDTDFPLDR